MLIVTLKNHPFAVIKIREMRGTVGKKTPNIGWIFTHFYDVTWLIFETLCPSNSKDIHRDTQTHTHTYSYTHTLTHTFPKKSPLIALSKKGQ